MYLDGNILYFSKIVNNRSDLNIFNMFFNYTQKTVNKNQKTTATTTHTHTARQPTFQYTKAKRENKFEIFTKIYIEYSQRHQKY